MASQRDCTANGDPDVLKLTPEAMAAIATIEAETELALREDGPLASLRDWGGKYVAAVARIAGLLHLAEHGGAKGLKIPISDTTVWAAADLGTYYKFGAISAFEVMATDPAIADAIYLLGKLKAAFRRHHLRTRDAARGPEVPKEG